MNALKCMNFQSTTHKHKKASQPVRINNRPTRAIQGQPMCRICSNAAFFDDESKRFYPGCTKSHSRQAIGLGYIKPRH